MRLAELWRYPVKSMGGEPLQRADLGPEGIPGDRVVHVEDATGRIVTSRSRPRLLLHHGALGQDGEPLVDGRPWSSAEVAADVRSAAGPRARLVRDDGLARFDVLPLLVATDGAVASLGYDRRRFRPNLLIGGVDGLAERAWEGKLLHVGGAVIRMVSLRQRCIMTTFDPDTAKQDVEVLLRIHRELGGVLALDCEVVQPGRITVGDDVRVGPERTVVQA
ncbi:MAG TPA: MOSC N-terminal beta barrel domain-containing protein [Polyangia bacterium]|nr:MOSC N-terminal beta barrel domain-containing protein [Polyangia bacterium]